MDRGDRRRLRRHSLVFFTARVAGAGATFATHWVLTRWIGRSQQGSYAELMSWVLLLASLMVLGIPKAALRFVPGFQLQGDRQSVGDFARFARRAACISGALITGVAVLFHLIQGHLVGRYWIALGCLIVLAWIKQTAGVAHGLALARQATLPGNVLRPIGLALVVTSGWLLGTRAQARDILLAHLGVLLAVACFQALWFRARVSLPPGRSTDQWKPWLRTAWPLALVATATNFLPELGVAISGALLDDGELSRLFIAYRLAWLVAFALGAVEQASLPLFSRLHQENRRGDLEQRLRWASRTQFLAAASGWCILLLFGRSILRTFGDGVEYQVAYAPALILSGALVVRSTMGPVAGLLGITGHHDSALRASLAVLLCAPIVHWAVVPAQGLLGAAWAGFVVIVGSQLWLSFQVIHLVRVMPSFLLPARQGPRPMQPRP